MPGLLLSLPVWTGCVIISGAEFDERLRQAGAADSGLDSGCAAPSVWYRDADGDGAGDPAVQIEACTQPEGAVDNASDCNDTDPTIGAEESWYRDADQDGYGDDDDVVVSCEAIGGRVTEPGDCDDSDEAINPAAREDCATEADEDCDGTGESGGTEEALGCTDYFPDVDEDGYGDDGAGVCLCAPSGEAVLDVGGDCNDTDAAISPGAEEVCGDGVDNNCDGAVGGCGWEGELSAAAADRELLGGEGWSAAGTSIASGDLTGDGVADVVVGAPGSNENTGLAVVWSWDEDTDLSRSSRIFTGVKGDYAGFAVHVADFDSDGQDDLVVGAHQRDGGHLYLSYGPIDSAGALDAEADVILTGDGNRDRLGYAVTTVRDWTGDLAPELVVAARDAEQAASLNDTGMVFIMGTPLPASASPADDAYARIWGDERDGLAGYSIHGGDIDDDGIDDIAIGAYGASRVQVVQGPVTTDVSTADASWTVRGTESSAQAGLGAVVGIASDVTGDGCGDLLMGSYRADFDATDSGLLAIASFCGASGELDLGDVTTRIEAESGMQLGTSVLTTDVDGDSVDDVLVGARSYDSSSRGAVLVFYGPVSGVVPAASADVVFSGEDGGDRLGSAASVADIDGDGLDDIVIGGPGLDAAAGSGVGGAVLFRGVGL